MTKHIGHSEWCTNIILEIKQVLEATESHDIMCFGLKVKNKRFNKSNKADLTPVRSYLLRRFSLQTFM